jgi:4-hydroxybenzoyl-CoA thioesterase
VASFVHRRRLSIEWAHCDPAGIVFNSRFFELFDGSTWALFETVLGVAKQDLFATFAIAGIPLVDARARFIAPLRFGDLVDLEAEVSAFRRSSFDVAHRITVGGELATEGFETRVWAAWDKHDPTLLRARPVPGEVMARFQRN